MRRREFLRLGGTGALLGLVGGGATRAGAAGEVATGVPRGTLLACERGGDAIHGFSLTTGARTFRYDGLHATHAIQVVPRLGRAFVHGRRAARREGALLALDLSGDTPRVLLDQTVAWFPLHWQPRHDFAEIAYNTVGDGALLVLDTETLEVRRFPDAGGAHSLMAFFEQDLVASNALVDDGHLRITDRGTGRMEHVVPVGPWPHGLSVDHQSGRALTWCGDGVHLVGLVGRERGRHLGVIPPFAAGQRCWFAWAPQGGRYQHDVSWAPGDVYHPYLTVVDVRRRRLERISSGVRRPGTLTVSDDGRLGLASSRNTAEALVFNMGVGRFEGVVPIGRADPAEFFDRDLSLPPGGLWASVTNPPERSVSLLDLRRRVEVGRIDLGFVPGWTKLHLA